MTGGLRGQCAVSKDERDGGRNERPHWRRGSEEAAWQSGEGGWRARLRLSSSLGAVLRSFYQILEYRRSRKAISAGESSHCAWRTNSRHRLAALHWHEQAERTAGREIGSERRLERMRDRRGRGLMLPENLESHRFLAPTDRGQWTHARLLHTCCGQNQDSKRLSAHSVASACLALSMFYLHAMPEELFLHGPAPFWRLAASPRPQASDSPSPLV